MPLSSHSAPVTALLLGVAFLLDKMDTGWGPGPAGRVPAARSRGATLLASSQ
jgi:hypothetical protein